MAPAPTDFTCERSLELRADLTVLAGDGVQFLNCLIRQSNASASEILSQMFH